MTDGADFAPLLDRFDDLTGRISPPARKALGFAMFVPVYPNLEIETRVGLRYKPDLIAYDAKNDFAFWGECGQNSIRKTHWILKHTRTEKMVLFKISANTGQLIKQIREEIPAKYRAGGRFSLRRV